MLSCACAARAIETNRQQDTHQILTRAAEIIFKILNIKARARGASAFARETQMRLPKVSGRAHQGENRLNILVLGAGGEIGIAIGASIDGFVSMVAVLIEKGAALGTASV